MEKVFFVYMLASKRNGTIYTGVTSFLVKRIYEHKNDFVDGFTKRYGVHSLVWFEQHENAERAIHREKRLKKYTRAAKIKLIESKNLDWKDLYDEICR